MAQTTRFIPGNNRSMLTLPNGDRCFILHHTQIVAATKDGQIILDTGGYFSATTRTAMNQASYQFDLGFGVYQKKGEWFATWKDQVFPFLGNTLTLS